MQQTFLPTFELYKTCDMTHPMSSKNLLELLK